MTVQERAELLLSKYSLSYIKAVVNSSILMYKKDDNIEKVNHWNDIAIYIKTKMQLF